MFFNFKSDQQNLNQNNNNNNDDNNNNNNQNNNNSISLISILAEKFSSSSEISSVRIYDFIIDVFIDSSDAAHRVENNADASSLLNSLKQQLQTDDILLKMNLIELTIKVMIIACLFCFFCCQLTTIYLSIALFCKTRIIILFEINRYYQSIC
jgi:hypothetical protein